MIALALLSPATREADAIRKTFLRRTNAAGASADADLCGSREDRVQFFLDL
jgi:hypothetical protein